MGDLRRILDDRWTAAAILAIAFWLLAFEGAFAAPRAPDLASRLAVLCAEAATGGPSSGAPHVADCTVHCHAVPTGPLAGAAPSATPPLRRGSIATDRTLAAFGALSRPPVASHGARAPPAAADV
ncbi:hypothetical protein [Methylobrevis albus]|uniref:DUF2946 domain-containing protein n=1 Tax=Methylobrevis albus TaxID=2793297 RepID=A0A931I1S4_9HYPH|nr:hypothetical protein [Methylobrevis albus]MBH0237676.1 hypothetical protein [Methylobrevis albus]